MGPGRCWERARSRNPRRGQTPEHPSVGEHPEPGWPWPHGLHSWTRPEWRGTCYGFADVSALGFSRILGGHWEDTGCR